MCKRRFLPIGGPQDHRNHARFPSLMRLHRLLHLDAVAVPEFRKSGLASSRISLLSVLQAGVATLEHQEFVGRLRR